ncbi:MAG: outer membrane beta-barrel protein [Saprospiraceae bacterium]|jgi:hypothetical protein|nr:outer membrane beta-barrel protein [Saprospiraceae bacterium]
MTKTTIIIGLLLLAHSAWSQCQWQFGVESNTFMTRGVRDDYLGYPAQHTSRLSQSIAVLSAQRINERWFFTTGLMYAYVQHQTGISALRWGSQHNGNGGFDPEINAGEPMPTVQYSHHYLALPLRLRYNITTGPWRLYVQEGFIGRIALKSSETAIPEGFATEPWISRRRAFTPALQTGLGLEKTIGRNLFVYIEPNIIWGQGPEDNQLSFGLAVGFRRPYLR